MKMKALLGVARWAALALAVLIGTARAEEAKSPESGPRELTLEISSGAKVIEPGESIALLWQIRGAGRDAGTVKVKAVRDFKVSALSSLGMWMSGSMEAGFTAEFAVAIDEPAGAGSKSITAAEMGYKDAWTAGLIRMSASCYVEAETKAAGEGGETKPVAGTLKSNRIEVVIKPEGWKEETYKKYLDGMHRMAMETFKPMGFEFPELRKLDEYTVTVTPQGAFGRWKLVREYLEIDDKAKTARLRTGYSSFEIAAMDPWARRDVPADLRGFGEDGLVAIDFRADITTNKWLAEKLPSVEEDMLKRLKEKGLPEPTKGGEEGAVAPPAPSPEEILRGGKPHEFPEKE